MNQPVEVEVEVEVVVAGRVAGCGRGAGLRASACDHPRPVRDHHRDLLCDRDFDRDLDRSL